MVNVAVLGAGPMGRALGTKFKQAHHVTLGTRFPDRHADLIHAGWDVLGYEEAAEKASIIVLAVPPISLRTILDLPMDDKIIIDATNELSFAEDGPTVEHQVNVTEQVAKEYPTSRIIKAFNTMGAERILDPVFQGMPIELPFACDDNAKADAIRIIKDLGFNPVHAGSLRHAKRMEYLAAHWIRLAVTNGLGRKIHFRTMGQGT